jgi:hypothetical protein
MPEPFTLTVPADARYRGLAPEVAGKYVELSGGAESDAAAFAEALSDALRALVRDAANGATVELSFRPAAGGIEVGLGCAGRTSVVRHRFPARTS